MPPEFRSALSTHDAESITVRDRDLTAEVMDELDFAAALYYLWTGDLPSDGERRLVDVILTSMLSHGKTGPAISARMTAVADPDAIQAAIASGVLCMGSRFGGPMQECSATLQELSAAADADEAVSRLVADHLERGERFGGLGHPYLTPVDPRAERILSIAETEAIAGEHVRLLRDVRKAFETELDREIPINVTGAIAAVTADMGLSPAAARALGVVSRAAGVAAEALEERDRPMALDVIEYVDGHTEQPDGE